MTEAEKQKEDEMYCKLPTLDTPFYHPNPMVTNFAPLYRNQLQDTRSLTMTFS
jgi:hypothetical protein